MTLGTPVCDILGVDLLAARPERLTAAVDITIANAAKAFIVGHGLPKRR